CQQNRNWSFTF
nr:immunoglobulin light chain junction region [Macaca mulatta]